MNQYYIQITPTPIIHHRQAKNRINNRAFWSFPGTNTSPLNNETPRRPGDPPRLVASSDKIREELGWQPEIPELEDIIASAWEWHKAHPNGYS